MRSWDCQCGIVVLAGLVALVPELTRPIVRIHLLAPRANT